MVESKFNLDALSRSSSSDDVEVHEAYGLQGFGGWLFLFQISIWLGIMMAAYQIIKGLELKELSSIMRVTEKSWETAPEYVLSQWLGYLQNPFIIIILIPIMLMFYFEKRQTVHWIRGYLIVISLISIANCWLSYYSDNYYIVESRIGEYLIIMTIISVIKNLIWIVYFTVSERVENTFDK
ncbi:DUF2569 family protein [Paenibacillus sp. Leaf72]|uniref:DUF2569 family protein n=1 Tax=Paenibacillus sp. Leaf72 TaxID=1736234 RepID=UPI00070103E0|nr:DUF2569 family protein [Paenibacillus sp. Leaf72]KQO16570.1 hypothetical protein ASF12_26420 [Paenibacillus sp. Leaf72]